MIFDLKMKGEELNPAGAQKQEEQENPVAAVPGQEEQKA